MVTVYHNLGLGDHLIFCGLAHTLMEKRGEGIRLYCKRKNIPTVKDLYQGYLVELIPVDDGSDIKLDSNCINLHRTVSLLDNFKTFDEEIYALSGVPHTDRWDNFKFNFPDTILRVDIEGYGLIHEDMERGFKIRYKETSNCNCLYAPKRYSDHSLLDYTLLILNADEVHVIDSCFRILADQLYCSNFFSKFRVNNKLPRLFYHRYAREVENNGWHVPLVKSPYWEVID